MSYIFIGLYEIYAFHETQFGRLQSQLHVIEIQNSLGKRGLYVQNQRDCSMRYMISDFLRLLIHDLNWKYKHHIAYLPTWLSLWWRLRERNLNSDS